MTESYCAFARGDCLYGGAMAWRRREPRTNLRRRRSTPVPVQQRFRLYACFPHRLSGVVSAYHPRGSAATPLGLKQDWCDTTCYARPSVHLQRGSFCGFPHCKHARLGNPVRQPGEMPPYGAVAATRGGSSTRRSMVSYQEASTVSRNGCPTALA